MSSHTRDSVEGHIDYLRAHRLLQGKLRDDMTYAWDDQGDSFVTHVSDIMNFGGNMHDRMYGLRARSARAPLDDRSTRAGVFRASEVWEEHVAPLFKQASDSRGELSGLLETLRELLEEEQRRFKRFVDSEVDYYIYIATQHPQDLLSMVELAEMSAGNLSIAAEACGHVPLGQRDFAFRVLEPLLKHQSSMVREGAILGIQRLGKASSVEAALKCMSANDPSNGVRATAKDALGDD